VDSGVERKLRGSLAVSNHEELYPGDQTDRHAGSGEVPKLVFFPLEAEGPILFHGALGMERKYKIQVLGGVQRSQLAFYGLESLIPPFSGDFFGLQMNPLLVVEADHVPDDLSSLDEVTDLMDTTMTGYTESPTFSRNRSYGVCPPRAAWERL
jgi:hypothetical protein